MLLQEERDLVVDYGKQMSSAGLSAGTSGNISIFNAEDQLMAISPSGMGYFETTPADVVVMDLDAHVIDSDRKPSSEWAMHSAFYKAKPHARAVVHTHSVYCTTFATLGQPLRSVHYVIGDAGASIVPCAPYQTYGTPELGEAAVATCGNGDAVLLGNHGLIVCGRNIASAFGLARNLEFIAEIQWRALCVGSPHIISDEEMSNVMKRFQTYGQNTRNNS